MTGQLPDTVVVAARAKLNLFLRVLGRRPDGYHDLESLVVRLDLADRLTIHAAADPSFRTLALSLDVEGEHESVRGVPVDETNLVLRAASALAEEAGVRGFADIALGKRIPAAAGLGGGSADAAATLRALNDLWGTGLREEELGRVGALVGSDVPALLPGGPVAMSGRGERIARAIAPASDWVLVTLSFGVSAADAYRWWDEDGAVTGADPSALFGAFGRGPASGSSGDLAEVLSVLSNDLEGPVLRRHPEIAMVKTVLADAGCAVTILAGSGSTMAGLLTEELRTLGGSVEAALEELTGRPVIYTSSAGSPSAEAGAAD